jgi:RNA 2',3'-cyclic 3'-phosphodiesterase
LAKTRTFIAVEAVDGAHAQAQTAIEHLRPFASNVKWVEPENLHWTLQFLGDLKDEELAEVCRRVQKAVAEVEPFSLTAAGVGAFPHVDRPRVLWLGAAEGAERFVQLQSAIEQNLESMGFRGENRRFVPHLTLGRVGPGGGGLSQFVDELNAMANFAGGQMFVDEVLVYSSEPQRSGPKYTPLAHLKLGG